MKIFIFESTRAVIKAESAVRESGIGCTVIPVPRSVSPLCGMALQIEDARASEAGGLFTARSIKADVFDRSDVKL